MTTKRDIYRRAASVLSRRIRAAKVPRELEQAYRDTIGGWDGADWTCPYGGELVEVHLLENLRFLAGRNALGFFENWMTMFSALGFLWGLAPWRWHRKSVFLRRACWLLPVAAAANLVLGRLAEPRLWNEWLSICMALAAQTVAEFTREERAARSAAFGSAAREPAAR